MKQRNVVDVLFRTELEATAVAPPVPEVHKQVVKRYASMLVVPDKLMTLPVCVTKRIHTLFAQLHLLRPRKTRTAQKLLRVLVIDRNLSREEPREQRPVIVTPKGSKSQSCCGACDLWYVATRRFASDKNNLGARQKAASKLFFQAIVSCWSHSWSF